MNLQVDVADQRDFETLAEIQLRAFENDSDSLLFPLLHPPSTLKPRPAARLRIATDMARRESSGHRFTKAIRWEKGNGEITGFESGSCQLTLVILCHCQTLVIHFLKNSQLKLKKPDMNSFWAKTTYT